MQRFGGKQVAPVRPHAFSVWCLCVAVLLGPSVLVWFVRIAALGMSCTPGPHPCRNIALGAGFRDVLALAWLIGSQAITSLSIAFVASVAALRLKRPLMAALSLLVLPLAALVLPTLAVYTALYPGCEANEAGVGDCLLWGAGMGMSFHRAAMAPWIIYGMVPYCFTLAMMIGAIGILFFRHLPGSPRIPLVPPRFNRAATSFDDSPE